MNTKALIEAAGRSRAGLLLVAERLGALLPDNESLQELAKGLTGTLPEDCDDYSWGIRDALLEMLCSAEANRQNRLCESYRLTQQQEKTQPSPVQPSESTPKKPGTK